MLNPFDQLTGSDRLKNPVYLVLLFFTLLIGTFIIGKIGLIAGFGLILLPFIFAYLYLIFKYPVTGIYTAVFLGFTILGLSRYVDFQVGLLMDTILFFTFIALIFNKFYERVDWSLAQKDITLLALIWFGYSLLELFNPELRSVAAWLNGVRGISMYMLLLVILTLLLVDNNRKLEYFFLFWGFLSLLASLKGIMQKVWGVDSYEQAWLDGGAAITHVLFGKLRIFSFLSDAGQFGANQAYSAVVAGIVAMVEKDFRKKIFYIVVAVLGIYGMLLSGTRGAIAIPLAGFGTFFVIKKNKVVMFSGFVVLILFYVFFKYTTIAQGNEQIRRMRTAFDPNDASFQVRLENQRILSAYLASRPFGGGIGHAGVKAKKYIPNGYLSQIATDSWYVMIWAEQGIVGLLIHLFILFYVVIKAGKNIMYKIRDPILKMRMSALLGGMVGVMVASYGNAVLGTVPTAVTIYISMALMLNTEIFDTPVTESKVLPVGYQRHFI